MSYYGNYWQGTRDPRADHEKVWRRSKATPWDEKWHALSPEARFTYLTKLKGPAREGSYNQPSTPSDKLPAEVIPELVAAGFVKVEPGSGKKSARVVPLGDVYDFTARVRSMHRYHLLGPSNREELTKYVKYAFYNQGETVINRVLRKAKVDDSCQLDEGLELYVTSRRWPGWVADSVDSKAARSVLDALRKATGPVPLAKLPGLVKSAKPDEVRAALDELIINLAVFEDIQPGTFELVVGLLPIVRGDLEAAEKPRTRPPLVVTEKPREVGPPGGLEVNDLRVFLLEVAGESPRLRQDGGIFQKEEPRFLAAMPDWPGWLQSVLKVSAAVRLSRAHHHARSFGFVEAESEDKQTWLRLSNKGRSWLALGIEDQYGKLYESLRGYAKKPDLYSYDSTYGDSKFLGVRVTIAPAREGGTGYYSPYHPVTPEQRQAFRDTILKAFERLPVGVFHRWDSVLDHLVFEDHNPLLAGKDASKSLIFLEDRPVPRLPERQEEAGKRMLDAILRARLLPFDAMQAAVDDQGRLCVARLPRLEGYFGRPYDGGETAAPVQTRVIVQPDFSVLVIGLDPSPAAELAPFCERTRGQLGQGAITYKITRDSIVRAVTQGLTARTILARLTKHASVAVPENVLTEVREWAAWVRLVNVRPVTVVRCPDRETVARVVSALGRKAERLSDTLVALNTPKLTSVERQKLQDQGVVVTKGDITPPDDPEPIPGAAVVPKLPKKRGRPKKAR